MAQINAPRRLVTPAERIEEQADGLQTAVARTRSFAEENRGAVIGAAVAVALLVIAIVAFVWWRAAQASDAEEALGTILTTYEAGEFEAALDGTGDTPGLLEIADEYGGATAAPFFAADALFQLGRYDEALTYFDMVDADGLIGASALAGEAAVYEQKGEFERAGGLYEQAAAEYASAATAPGYLLDAGRAYTSGADMGAAEAAYQRLLDEYDETPEATTAQVELAAVRAAATATGTATGDVEPAAPAGEAAADGAAEGEEAADDAE